MWDSFITTKWIIIHHFLEKLHAFTKFKFIIRIVWKTRKIRTLFNLKDRNIYPDSVIYKGTCKCGSTYIGETDRNVATRWKEHNDTRKNSEPAKHIKNNLISNHEFVWEIMRKCPSIKYFREIIEAFYVALKKPNLNTQVKSKKLLLFLNGVT